jgi:hypothetical protein
LQSRRLPTAEPFIAVELKVPDDRVSVSPIVAEFEERYRFGERLDRRVQIRHCEPFITGAAHLTSGVLTAVLGAALLHALRNWLVKSADHKFLSSTLIALWCGVAAFAATLVLPWPSRGGAVHRSLGAHPYPLFSAGRAALSQCSARGAATAPLGRLRRSRETLAVYGESVIFARFPFCEV